MLKKSLLFFVLNIVSAIYVYATYDFAVANSDGVTIYYNQLEGSTNVEVTYRTTPQTSSYQDPIIVIPEQIIVEGQTYSVTSIGQNAFSRCYGLRKITIPNSVTSIGLAAFSDSGLSDIIIPNSVISIGQSAFIYCSDLYEITIPNSVISIGQSAFSNCNNLYEITIPNSVTAIESYTFSSCKQLRKITIPNSVTSIGLAAFVNCSKLTEINIPNSVISIESYAFCNCSVLTQIILPNTVSFIGNFAFSGCSQLKEIKIPPLVTSIGTNTFSGCSSLMEIVIPNQVTLIESSAFSDCSSLKNVILEDGIETLIFGNNVFYDSIDTLYLGRNILYSSKAIPQYPSFDSSPFYNSVLKNLTISNSVTDIPKGAFYGCSSLTGILVIPNSVKSIGDYAFYNCSGLTGMPVIPNSVKFIGQSAFYGCRNFTGILNLTGIYQIDDYAFAMCSNLTKVTLFGVTKIYRGAFIYCSNLQEVIIGNSITSIQADAFTKCPILQSIRVMKKNPVECGIIFDADILAASELHVPVGSKSLYQNAPNWRNFIHIIDDIEIQTIDFPTLESKTYGDEDIILSATTDKGSPIYYEVDEYSSESKSVVTIQGNVLTIAEGGTVNICASQDPYENNEVYAPAEPIIQSLTVNKAILTITAENKSRPYREENPPFTVLISGLKNNDTENDLTNYIYCSADKNSNVGFYDILVFGGDSKQYEYLLNNGKLEITKVTPIINFPPIPELYIGDEYTLQATSTSISSDGHYYVSSDNSIAYIFQNVLYALKAGEVSIYAYKNGNYNYNDAEPVVQTVKINATTSINPIENSKIQVYPTFVKQGEKINININDTDAVLKVYNLNGKFINSQIVTNGLTSVAAPSVPGVYIFKILCSNGEWTNVKIIVGQ